MQEGTIFFLISWLAIWYILFMENGPAWKRSRHLITVLIILVCAGIYMNIVQIQVNFILVPVLLWSFRSYGFLCLFKDSYHAVSYMADC